VEGGGEGSRAVVGRWVGRRAEEMPETAAVVFPCIVHAQWFLSLPSPPHQIINTRCPLDQREGGVNGASGPPWGGCSFPAWLPPSRPVSLRSFHFSSRALGSRRGSRSQGSRKSAHLLTLVQRALLTDPNLQESTAESYAVMS
jgi:hypothetical protein